MNFTINSLRSGSSLAGISTNAWRVFKLDLPGLQNKAFFICDDAGTSFLSMDNTTGAITMTQAWRLDTLIISVSGSLHNGTSLEPSIASLLWKLLPLPANPIQEGNYQFIWPGPPFDRCIARGPGPNTAPTIYPADQSETSRWWRLSVEVSSAGDIYQSLQNYLSGEYLQWTSSGFIHNTSHDGTQTQFQILCDGQTASISIVGDDGRVMAVDESSQLVLRTNDLPATWKVRIGFPVLATAPTLPPVIASSLTTTSWQRPAPDVSYTDPTQACGTALLPPLRDGLYRVINESTHRLATLAISHDDHGPSRSLAAIESGSDSVSIQEQTWRIKRLTNYQGLIYQIISVCDSALLAEDSPNIIPGFEGRSCCPTREDLTSPAQLWSIEPQSNFAFAIKSCQSNCLLDDRDGLKTTPLVDSPLMTQHWKLVVSPSAVTSGIYRLKFQNGNYLQASNDRSPAGTFKSCRVTSQSDGSTTIEIGTGNGFYFLGCDSRGHLVLTETCQDSAQLKFVPTGDETPGFYLQHCINNLTVTSVPPVSTSALNGHGDSVTQYDVPLAFSARFLGSSDQILNLETPPVDIPSISAPEMVPTFAIEDGLYTIISSRQTYIMSNDYVHVSPPTIPKSRSQASGIAPTSGQTRYCQWAIRSTRNGFYTISNNGLQLCQATTIVDGPTWPYSPQYPAFPGISFSPSQNVWSPSDVICTTPLYDAARWRLVSIDGQTFNIVNYLTGDLVQVDISGLVVCAKPFAQTPALAAFQLLRLGGIPPTTPPMYQTPPPMKDDISMQPLDNSIAVNISRELDFAGGVYLLSFESPPGSIRCLGAPSNCASDTATTIFKPDVGAVDSEAYSLSSGLQRWRVDRDDQGWYTIEHYIYGVQLGAVCGNNNGLKTYPSGNTGVGLYSVPYASSQSDNSIFQWKFIQIDQRVAMINKACDNFYLVNPGGYIKFAAPMSVPSFWLVSLSG